MLGVLRGRTPLGASVGQNPAVVFYVATMFTLIVLVMHVWLRKHSEETASRLEAEQRLCGSGRHRGRSAPNDTDGGDYEYSGIDKAVAVGDEFLATRPTLKSGNASDDAGIEKLPSRAVVLQSTLDDRENLDRTTWFIKWLRKKLGLGWLDADVGQDTKTA
ncbi:hypothetical protein HPB50_011927 [Hyalomma asiaticum]|uniref:Uncharacterized protein n=1 Tax=Hyalomma asiaticum TaxID=266040 RepID=A0ACB7SXU3_HYAAI|nr:hypothetical protein HPB50_011927 [Hyalomma asiaticum]